jgi:hypothetical protein
MYDDIDDEYALLLTNELVRHPYFDELLLEYILDDSVGYQMSNSSELDKILDDIIDNRRGVHFGLEHNTELVAIGFLYNTRFGKSVDIFVKKSERGKGHGYMIASAINDITNIEIWATSMDNIPSIKIAHKLGLVKPSSHSSDYAIRLTR